MNERERAIDILRRIESESLYASIVLRSETGFVRTLVLGVLRWRSRLDFIVSSFARRKIDASVLDVLRLGAFQLIYSDVAAHAAVDETVNLAPKHARGFVNAILRRIAEGKAPEPKDLATRSAHPAWLIDRWVLAYGGERAEAIALADQELSYPDVLALQRTVPPAGERSSLAPDIWKLRASTADLDRREFWPMDEGSAVVAAIAAAAGSVVVDVAAAPGGKSLYVRHAGSKVISHDISLTRLMPLREMGGAVVVGDGRQPPFASRFPVVLLDAPCSATGTIRKNPELKWRLKPEDLPRFATLQKELLASALELASDVCIYATCSLEREENDDVVSSLNVEILDIARYAPKGVAPWIDASGVLRLTPESGADGFTVFALRPR